jgi:hypothetical protein
LIRTTNKVFVSLKASRNKTTIHNPNAVFWDHTG